MKDKLVFAAELFNAAITIHEGQYCRWDGRRHKPLNALQVAKIEGNYELYLNALPMQLLREERNKRIAEEDWRILRAYSQGIELDDEWKTYLQELRDLPETAKPSIDENGNLTEVTWPTKPSN